MPPTSYRPLLHKLLFCICAVPFAGHAQPFNPLTEARQQIELLFAPQSAELTHEAKGALRQLVDKLNLRGSDLVRIQGHADANETEPQALALQRARAAEFHLWQLGVYPRRTVVAAGQGGALAGASRRVQVQSENFTGLPPPAEVGLHFMGWWADETLLGKRPLPKGAAPQPTPHDFLPRVEQALRPRFLRLMQLAAIRARDDEWLISLRAMDDGSRADEDPLPPALYAQMFGTPRAQAMTQADAASLPAADPRRLALAQRVWCSEAQSAFPRPRMETLAAVLPASQALQGLAGPEQLTWIACAQHSAEALRWLRQQQGVNLDTKRQPDGWTPLHAAVTRGDVKAAAALLQAGANPRTTDDAGDTPLHRVAHPDHPVQPSSIQQQLWEQLLMAGADREAQNRQGQPARHYNQPLPPRDERIADRWPPEVKRRVDNLLALFSSRTEAPTPEEVMSLLDVELREIQTTPDEAQRIARLYGVHASDPGSAQPTRWRDRYTPHYVIYAKDAKGSQLHSLSMPISSQKFCLDPYELAIYTGESFLDSTPLSPHANPGTARQDWEYARDMFKRSRSNTFWAKKFGITTSATRNPQTGAVTDEGCVSTMGVGGAFPK